MLQLLENVVDALGQLLAQVKDGAHRVKNSAGTKVNEKVSTEEPR